MFLQCFDTVGWVIWPIKPVPNMTYNVFGGTLNLNQSINQSLIKKTRSVKGSQNPFFRRMCSYPQVTTACRAFHWQILLGCMYRWAQKCNYVINTQTFSKKNYGLHTDRLCATQICVFSFYDWWRIFQNAVRSFANKPRTNMPQLQSIYLWWQTAIATD